MFTLSNLVPTTVSLSWRPRPRFSQQSSSVLSCATKNKHGMSVSAKKEGKNPSLSFFSFLARPNMLSLDRFQSCFNSLKKWNKITIYILDSWQVLCVLTAPAKSKKKKKSFHSALSWIFGVLEVWEMSKCTHNKDIQYLKAGTYYANALV